MRQTKLIIQRQLLSHKILEAIFNKCKFIQLASSESKNVNLAL